MKVLAEPLKWNTADERNTNHTLTVQRLLLPLALSLQRLLLLLALPLLRLLLALPLPQLIRLQIWAPPTAATTATIPIVCAPFCPVATAISTTTAAAATVIGATAATAAATA